MVPTRLLHLQAAVMAFGLAACSPLVLQNVNFGWPVESVVTVSPSNAVQEGRYALSFSVAPLAAAEFGDSTALRGTSLRLMRNVEGYYFVTGPKFKHVYVFTPRDGALTRYAALEVSTTGLGDPAFNLRPPYVELIDPGSAPRLLTSSDIVEGKK